MTVLLVFILFFATSVESKNSFSVGDELVFYASHLGPSRNPQETYRFHSFPFCIGGNSKFQSLGEALQGIRLVSMKYSIRYRVETSEKVELCQKKLNKEEAENFRRAITQEYWYQLFFLDLPVWGVVGKYSDVEDKHYLFTHQDLLIGYNDNDEIVSVSLEPGAPVAVEEGLEISYTYRVVWEKKNLKYGQRFDRYLDFDFFEHKIHWFSVINSLLMVLFLGGVLVMILLRTMRQDLSERIEDFHEEFGDETNWKKLSQDIFRPPRYVGLFSVYLGTGVQLVILMFSVIFLSIVGSYYDDRGSVKTAFIVLYVVTSIIAGFVSGSTYVQNRGKNWIRTMILTSFLFPFFCVTLYGVMDFFALIIGSTQAIPFVTVVVIFGLHTFLTIPLVFVGTILGRSFNSDPKFPIQPKMLKRHVPRKRWYTNRFVIVLAGGVLPFGGIFIELKYVLDAVFSYRVYYVYGFFLVVYVILIAVTVAVSIILIYFVLLSEDYRYHWTAFCLGASTGFYTFLYSLYFYTNTEMSGTFQFVYFLTYSTLLSLGIGYICGTVAYYSAYYFVRKIYQGIRVE